MQEFDVVIVGASFSGLTLAHHLPNHLRVLVVEAKPTAGATVESTGLITVKTREEFASFFPIADFITNPISSICVIAPGFRDHFVSTVQEPWIFQTDTKALMRQLAASLPGNVTLLTSTAFIGVDDPNEPHKLTIRRQGKEEMVKTKFLVGADGGSSRVAIATGLERNRKFLFGYEQVFFGRVHLGPNPETTIYHFWFGEFSLGYGGWLSPTIVEGKPAFRIGLAKLMEDRADAPKLMRTFIEKLAAEGVITFDDEKANYTFGSLIPIGGALQKVQKKNVILVGDAAGFCGAFAADGIKGSVVSGKEAAALITARLQGKEEGLAYHAAIDRHGHLMEYFFRQRFYRWVWDRMKRDRTFRAMYDIISAEGDAFLDQFCDSKDKRKHLSGIVFKPKHFGKVIRYSVLMLIDVVFPPALMKSKRG